MEQVKQSRREIVIIGLAILINFIVWITGGGAHISFAKIYLLYFMALVVLFSNKKIYQILEKPFVWLMIINVFCCSLEIQLGLISSFINTFRPIYLEVANFFSSEQGVLYNTNAIIRKITDYIIFVRPSGLFGNLHLSTFILFCFFVYLNIQQKQRILQWMIAIVILLSGTFQTDICLLMYLALSLISKRNIKQFAIFFGLLVVPFLFFLNIIYGPQRAHEYNNMFRIIQDSILVFKHVPLNILMWGGDIYAVIDSIKSTVSRPEMLIESGILRYTISLGLINIFLIIYFIVSINKSISAGKKNNIFIIATLGTFIHYFMNATFIGSLIVAFVFRSNQLITANQNLRIDDIE